MREQLTRSGTKLLYDEENLVIEKNRTWQTPKDTFKIYLTSITAGRGLFLCVIYRGSLAFFCVFENPMHCNVCQQQSLQYLKQNIKAGSIWRERGL